MATESDAGRIVTACSRGLHRTAVGDAALVTRTAHVEHTDAGTNSEVTRRNRGGVIACTGHE